MSTTATAAPSGFEVTVEGTYFVKEGKDKGLRSYSFNFKLPEMEAALSIIKNKVLDRVLKKKYEDYVSYRTYQITNVKPFGDARLVGGFDLWSSSRDEVEKYIRKSELPVKLKYYPTLMSLREAVQLVEADESRFLLNQAQLEKDFEFTESLRALNPDMYDEAEDAPNRDDGQSDLLTNYQL